MRKIKLYLQKLLCRLSIRVLDKYHNFEAYDHCTLQQGNVVWAIMPLDNDDLMRIAPGHRIRPFVIKQVDETKCICYSCSSSLHKKTSKSKQYFIDKNKYNLQKSSYVDASREWHIPYENVQAYFYSLLPSDFQNILEIAHKKYNTSSYQEFGIGTVIQKENEYFVIMQIKNQKYFTHPLKEKSIDCTTDYQPFAIHRKVYYLEFGKTIKIDIADEEIVVKMQLSKLQINELKKKRKTQKNHDIEDKQSLDLLKNLTMKYPIGTIFYASYQDQSFIYLYHSNNRVYGFYTDEMCGGHYILRRESIDYMKQDGSILDRDDLIDALQRISSDPTHAVVLHLLLKSLLENKILPLEKKVHSLYYA